MKLVRLTSKLRVGLSKALGDTLGDKLNPFEILESESLLSSVCAL